MRKPIIYSSCLVFLITTSIPWAQQAPPLVAPTEALSPADEMKGFKLPKGYVVQLVASEPDIFKPMNLSFDYKGRIWITDSLEYPYAAKDGTKPRDSVKILSNIGPDGKAQKIETFAEGLNIPIGLLPLPSKKGAPQTALVHSIPNVYKMQDNNNDNKADTKEPFLTGFGFRDTHGMTNSFQLHWDGWIHATHGFSNDSEVKSSEGKLLKMNSGNTYRYRPDGTGLQSYTRGQVNPFGMTVDSWGNFYTADCHSSPIYQLLQGATYPSFSKPHDGLGFGPDMIKHSHGSTGICGITALNSDSFPEEHQETMIIGNVVTSRINHDRVDRKGATPSAVELPDFMTSEDLWFRPVDIKMGPDGALYILDFYNKVIGHYEVPLTHPGRDRNRGRIWRVFYTGKDGKLSPPPLPDFTAMSVEELIKNLGSKNQTMRIMAGNELVAREDSEATKSLLAAINKPADNFQQVHAMWALLRLNALPDQAIETIITNPAPFVRVHGIKMATSKPQLNEGLATLVQKALEDTDGRVQIAAVQGLAQHPSEANLKSILSFRTKVNQNDSHLYYASRLALREQVRNPEAWKGLPSQSSDPLALKALADVALGLPGASSAAFLANKLALIQPEGDREIAVVRMITRDGTDADKTNVVNYMKNAQRPKARQAELIRAASLAAQEKGSKVDPILLTQATDLCGYLLASKQENDVRIGTELAASLQLIDHLETIINIAKDSAMPTANRLACITSLGNMPNAKATNGLLETAKNTNNNPEVRDAAIIGLGKTLSPEVRTNLLAMFAGASARLQSSLALAIVSTSEGANDFLKAIGEGKASARLLLEKPIENKLKQRNLPDFDKKLATLTKGLPPADQLLQKKIADKKTAFLMGKHDEIKGEALFGKHCAACHQIANKGAKIGPQLDGIGSRGLDRLLEDMLDPNRNVDQAFRQTTLALKNGQLVNGLLLREEGVLLVLADQQGKEVRIASDQVEERKISPVSPMPAGFVDQITNAEFADLMAYLLSNQLKK
jgi:putative heme-binding domain-containing protein